MGITRAAGRRFAVVGVLGLALVAGCSAESGSSDSAEYDMAQEEAYAASDSAADGGAEMASGADGAVDPAAASARMVIQTGSISIVSDDPVATANAVVGIVTASGGRTDNRSVVAASEYQRPSAWLTVRVPAEALDSVLEQIAAQGELVESSISADDVTLTGQDLDARIEAKELSVERLENLLAGATTSEEIITAEQSLTQRQSELEQLKAERAWLGEQVALSTVSVNITLPDDVPVTPPTGFIGGLTNGWNALVDSLVAAMAVVGFLLPWLVIAGIVVAIVLWSRKRWGKPKAAKGAAAGSVAAPAPMAHAIPATIAATAPASPSPAATSDSDPDPSTDTAPNPKP